MCFAVMATCCARISYGHASGSGCSVGLRILDLVVLVVGCNCVEGIHLLFVGSNFCSWGISWIMSWLYSLCNTLLGYWCDVKPM